MTKKKAAKSAPKAQAAAAAACDRRYLDKPGNPRRRADDGAYVEPSKPIAYPAVRYHETLGARTVANETEDKALGEGWTKKPSAGASVNL